MANKKTITEFQLVDVTQLIPYVNNARTHSPEQIKQSCLARAFLLQYIPIKIYLIRIPVRIRCNNSICRRDKSSELLLTDFRKVHGNDCPAVIIDKEDRSHGYYNLNLPHLTNHRDILFCVFRVHFYAA